jgi:hypothetical protein
MSFVAGLLTIAVFPFVAVGSTWLSSRDRRQGFAAFSLGWLAYLLVLYQFADWYFD